MFLRRFNGRSTAFRNLVLLVVLVSLVGLTNQATTAQSSIDLKDIALKSVARRTGIPVGELAVANTSTASYPLQGKTGSAFKVMHSRTGEIYGVTLEASGRELDAVGLEKAERAAHDAKYGRLDPALTAQLARATETTPLDVIVWLKEDAYERPARPEPASAQRATPEQASQFLAQVDAKRSAAVQALVTPLQRRLARLDPAAVANTSVPVISARLTPRQIREVANWPEVDQIYTTPTNEAELQIVGPTVGANTVQGRGITGANVQIAQIEVGGRVATANPNLGQVTQDGTNVCGTASAHSTGVAGIIVSTDATDRGIAPGATLWAGGSCAGSSSELQNRSTAAADWGARAINLSWGSNSGLTPGANDRFYDDMVINRYRTIVKSAGNEAGPCRSGTGNITSPGLAYNVITVGNFDDNNSFGWSDDFMSSCSSWNDPTSTHGDREKPEVSAPGSGITSTTTSWPWIGPIGSGTSFAAPVVTGISALLIQRSSGLAFWPESVKAIMMASALHNIEGDGRLSEFDGAGGVTADRADDMASFVNGGWSGRSYKCSEVPYLSLMTISLNAGTRTRAVMTWDSNTSYGSYASQPGADLDLAIYDPAGNVVAASASWDNTYEIIDFTPAATGSYTLKASKYRCDSDPSWLGLAWRQGN